MTMPADLESLDALYKEKLNHFDKGAVVRKWRYQALWVTITGLTFLNLVLAALSEHFDKEAWFRGGFETALFNKTLANVLFSLFGLAIIGLTVFQTRAGLQSRWLSYRGAAERLRRNCMLFRAGLPPFDGDQPVAMFRKVLEEICQVADRQDSPEGSQRFNWRQAWALWNMPQEAGRSAPSAPDQGLLLGPLRDPAEVLDGRLHNQRQWYLRKARSYFRDYLVIQLGIVLCSAVNILHFFALGERLFWLVVVSTTISLGLIACRDFLDWGPLFVRYLQTATNLKTIEEAYLERQPPFDMPSDAERLKKLAEQVEQTLAMEFQYWIYTRR
jgi:SMODS and SLOG-associating 2TM effector domain 1